jgi:hypothetical protein
MIIPTVTTASGPIPASFSSPTTPSVSGSLPSSLASLATEARRVAEMIEKLPPVCYANDVVPLLQQAGVECFFVHVRGMIEFLGIKPAPRDRAASDLLPNWTPRVDQPTRARLEDYWLTASQHVMHFGQVRTKQEDGTQVRVAVEQADLEAIANDVLTLWDQFAEEVKKANLMGGLQMPKRGSFKTWNVDGTSTRTEAKRRGIRPGFLARWARLRWRP